LIKDWNHKGYPSVEAEYPIIFVFNKSELIILINLKNKMNIDISTSKWEKIGGNFCSDKWLELDSGIDNIEDIKVIERIGSLSAEGEVYRVIFKEVEYAGKIMPINSVLSYRKNENEISIAKEMSQDVISGKTEYFPIVYASGFCKNTKYSEKSLFIEDSYRYFLFEKICANETSACKKRMINKYKDTSKKELEEIFINVDIDISSHIMISSMAFSDLRELSNLRTVNLEAWDFIIISVLKAIKYMNEEKSILHNDLHLGNILILINDSNILVNPLIHDFGKSIRIVKWNICERKTDPEKFLYDLTLNPKVPFYTKNKIYPIIEYIRSLTESIPILDNIIDMYIDF